MLIASGTVPIRLTPGTLNEENMPAPDWEGFGRAIMEEWGSHTDLEASDRFELALKFNILREVPGGFNPEIHVDSYYDAEPGDPWYEVNESKSEKQSIES